MRKLLLYGAAAVLLCGPAHAQSKLLQAHASGAPAYSGPCDKIHTSGSAACLVYWGMVAGKAAYASANGNAFDYSCNAGANTGTVTFGSTGLPNTAAMVTACGASAISIQLYEQIAGVAACKAVNATVANQPTRVAAAIGSVDGMAFNGSSQVIITGTCTTGSGFNTATVGGGMINFSKRTTVVSFHALGDDGASNTATMGYGGSGVAWYQFGGPGINPAASYTETKWSDFAGVTPTSGGTSALYVNGTSVGTATATSAITGNVWGIGGSSSGGILFTGQLMYFGVISGTPTTGDVTAFHNNNTTIFGAFP